MGGAKSVTTFFVTSSGPAGNGGDLGGLVGADAHCQALARAEGSGDHTWRAYLSTTATATAPAVHARARIGKGPWYNAEGFLVAANISELHGDQSKINKDTAVTERLDQVGGVGDTPNAHDMLTGSRPDGTAFDGPDDLTCGNWTSSTAGRAQVGHHDRMGQGRVSARGIQRTPRVGAVNRTCNAREEPGSFIASPSTDWCRMAEQPGRSMACGHVIDAPCV
jgi:hypothetical protein